MRWTAIAAANGRHAHPGMQLGALTGNNEALHSAQRGVFDGPPRVGTIPPELTIILAAALARHTTTPDRCWFAVWNGFAATRDDVRQAPTFLAPHREYHLLQGPTEAATESVTEPLRTSRPTSGGRTVARGASPLRSISTARTSVATTLAAMKSLLCQRSRRCRSIPQPESASVATSITPSTSRARAAATESLRGIRELSRTHPDVAVVDGPRACSTATGSPYRDGSSARRSVPDGRGRCAASIPSRPGGAAS